jgi:hypothetical protein
MDKIDPKKKVQIRKVQKWQKENVPITAIAKGFKKYKNYYVPEKLVKNSNRVLSFGVGADVKFEKLLCKDNHDLQVKLFDPTPLTTKYIAQIIKFSSSTDIGSPWNMRITRNCFEYKPIAYSPVNGIQKFYYSENTRQHREDDGAWRSQLNILPDTVYDVDVFSLKKEKGSKSIDVDCKNLETIMNDLNWGDVDIIKADIEGMWWEFCNELLDKNIKFRYLVMEWELIFDELSVVLEKAKILCDKFNQKGYNVYLNKVRGKMMLEVIFIRKDVEEFINKPLHTY